MIDKTVLVSVSNDYATDKRVQRSCKQLIELGYQPKVFCRKLKNSPELPDLPYEVNRMKLLFNQGALFYVELNIRLFFKLFMKTDLLLANDLDTLFPNYLVSRIRNVKIIYDAHEYYTGVPELKNRNFIRKIWKWIEKICIPRLGEMITVNQSIADLYSDEFGVDVAVVRNMPEIIGETKIAKTRADLDLPDDQHIILMQGSGINVQRGAEEAVLSMQYLEGKLLLIIGGGDVISVLKNLVKENALHDKVMFLDRMSPENLKEYTRNADLGLSLDKGDSINYLYSLPNKLMDYIHAGIPILASKLPEVRNIIESYSVGEFIEQHDPKHIAKRIDDMFSKQDQMQLYAANCSKAAKELNWEKESRNLREFILNLKIKD